MFPCIKRRTTDRGPVASTPRPAELKTPIIKAVIMIDGHTSYGFGHARGTTTYNDKNENDINHQLIALIQSKWTEEGPGHLKLFRLHRKKDAYWRYKMQIKKDIKDLAKKHGLNLNEILVVEYHLNDSDDPNSLGVEALANKHKSAMIAAPITKRWSDIYGIKLRRKYKYNDGEKEVNVRGIYFNPVSGGGFLSAVGSLGCFVFLWEPFFCGTRTNESSQFLDDISEGLEEMSSFWVSEFKLISNLI